jgi:hypothetical protein
LLIVHSFLIRKSKVSKIMQVVGPGTPAVFLIYH